MRAPTHHGGWVTARRGSSYYNAETRRRSGRKQSRTERRERSERRALMRGKSDEHVERRFGILLQGAVAKQLARLGVPHRLIDYRDDYARDERVELAVLDRPDGDVLAEFQYTLRRGVRGKIEDFIRAATVRATRDVLRIYLEVEDHVGYALKPMAERVAHAIREIMEELPGFAKRVEQGNVIGLALVLDHGKRSQLFPMRLMRMLGSRARDMLEALLAPPVPPPAIENAPEAHPPKPRPTSLPPPVPFYLRIVESIRERFNHGFVPSPAPVYAAPQRNHPLRMPFRR